MADFDAQLPVRSTALEFTTEVANAAGTTINPSEDYAQGSTTSGENGVLSQGAVTTAPPTYITGTTNPLSLDTSGNLRVTIDSSVSEQNVNLNQVGGSPITLGQTTMSASIPVTIASNQSILNMNEAQLNGVALGSPSNYGTSPGAVEVQGVNAFITNTPAVTLASTTITGTVAVTQSTSPWVVSLASTTITGTVTAAGNLTNNNAAPIADNLGVLPALANAAHPTWTEGDQVLLSEDLSGNLRVITGTGSTTAVTGNVTVVQPTGSNLNVAISNFPALSAVNVTQWDSIAVGAPSAYGTSPGPVNVIGVNAYITNTVPVTLASTTITGTVAVTQSTSPWVVSLASTTITGTVTVLGNLTNNNAAPAANNVGVLPAVAAAAAPTWTTGDQVLLSEDLSGNLRVKSTTAGPVTPGAVATNSDLVGGQYNSTPPTLTTGQQVALQVDANGRLLVDTNASASITPVLTYFTDASVAKNASVTHSLAGPCTLDEIDFAGSGEIKGTVAIGITGSEVTYWNGFNSAAGQELKFIMPTSPSGYVIPSGSSAKITILNRDNQAQDTYVTFFSH